MKKHYFRYSLNKKTIFSFFLVSLLVLPNVYSSSIKTNHPNSALSANRSGKSKITKGNFSILRINDTTDASFGGLDSLYCRDSTVSFPVTFTPPAPAPASSRIFVRISGNGITSTGQYTANFKPITKGKYKINYIVQDSITVQVPITQWSPIVRDSKGRITSGCDCYVVIGQATVRQLGPEKIGYSSSDVTVGIGNFIPPASKCNSEAAFDLSNFTDPAYNTGLAGTGFSILSSSYAYPPGVLSGTMFDPSLLDTTVSFTVQYKYVGAICTDSTTAVINVYKLPRQPSFTGIVPGSIAPCAGASIGYSVTPIPEAASYSWQLPAGWSGNSTGSSISVIPSRTAGNVRITAVNACGSSPPADLATVPNFIPDQPVSVTGAASPCHDSSTVYSTASVAGVDTYNWIIPSGWTGTSTTNSISVIPGTTLDTIAVTATNVCGTSTAQGLIITPNSTPATPGAITGLAVLTQSTTDNPFSIDSVSAATSYTWSYTGTGSTINNGSTKSIGIDFSSTASSGSLSVTATNACGTSAANSIAITVNPSVVNQPAAFTSSTAAICTGQTGVQYTVPNDPAVTYNWTYSGSDVTITGTSNSVTLDYGANATGGTLSVTAAIGTVSSSPRSLIILVNSIPAISTSIVGSVTPYEGISTTYSLAAVAGATSYNWTIPGWVGNSSTNSISVIPNATAGSVAVKASNYCGISNTVTLTNVTPGVKPVDPGNITGSILVTPGTTASYSIAAIPGATSYTWSYSGAGATINGSGASITIDYSSSTTSGTLSVIANNVYGSSSASYLSITPAASTVTAVVESANPAPVFLSYPNPYNDQCTIKVSYHYSTSITLKVVDVFGLNTDIVANHFIEAGDNEFTVPELASGVYQVILYLEDKIYMTRIVRTK